MLVKLTNTSLATRIFHDTKGKQHIARVGKEITLDVHPNVAARYKRSQENGEPLTIEPVEENETINTELRDPERKSIFTLGNTTQGQTRAEMEGRMPKAPVMHEDIPAPPPKRPDPIGADAANAAQQGAADAGGGGLGAGEALGAATGEAGAGTTIIDITPPKEPATAAELITAIEAGGMGQDDQVRLATAILPKNTLPMRPKPGQLMSALRKQAQSDSK